MHNLLYISNTRPLKKSANSIQSFRQAIFLNSNFLVTMYHRGRRQSSKLISEFYGFNYNLMTFGTFEVNGSSRLHNYINGIFSFFSVLIHLINHTYSYIYFRDDYHLFTFWLLKSIGIKSIIIFEDHDNIISKYGIIAKFLVRKLDGLVATNNSAYCDLSRIIDCKPIILAENGVDTSRFKFKKKKYDRKSVFRIGYFGNLNEHKGVYTLVDAMSKLTLKYELYVYGGNDRNINRLTDYISNKGINNVKIQGHISYSKIPITMSSVHCLVISNSNKYKISAQYTSPLKLFEYMATSIPIIATNVPSITDYLNESNAKIVEPDSADDLCEAIRDIEKNYLYYSNVATVAANEVAKYDIKKRTRKIADFIQSL